MSICDECDALRKHQTWVPYGDTTVPMDEWYCVMDKTAEECENDETV